MKGYFGIEFYEIETPLRSRKLQGGGVHGNMILSRFKPKEIKRIDLPTYFDWENLTRLSKYTKKIEPRLGNRTALICTWEIANVTLIVCSAHLEDKAGGIAARQSQFEHIIKSVSEIKEEDILIVAGDFNTYENGLSRLVLRRSRGPILNMTSPGECTIWQKSFLPSFNLKANFPCNQWTFRVARLFKVKLDWIISSSNCRITARGVEDFNTSDHRPLWIEIEIPKISSGSA